MNKRIVSALAVGVVSTMIGCDLLTSVLLPSTITIELVNESSDFGVEVTLYHDSQQDVPEFLIEEAGTQVDRTVSPGETATITLDCDDAQAVVITDADLEVLGGAGPEENTDVLRDNSDFSCGDTIRYTFTHSDLLFDFRIGTSVVPFVLVDIGG